MDANGNNNNLAGLQCPQCGQAVRVRVTAESVFHLYDDGTEKHEDLEYDGNAAMICLDCSYSGTSDDFYNAYKKAHGEYVS